MQATAIRRPVRLAWLIALGALAALAVVAGFGSASTSVGPTVLTGNATWTAAGSPYYVEGNVVVRADSNLTIDPGVDVFFNGSYSLVVAGGCSILGNESMPVHFASNNTTAVPVWSGIRIAINQYPCEIRNLTIDRPSTGIDILQSVAPINISDTNVTNATSYGFFARFSNANVTVERFFVENSEDGMGLNNTSHVYVTGYRTRNLGGNAYSLSAVTVTSCDFSVLDFPDSRMQVMQSKWVNITEVNVSSLVFPIGLEFESDNTLALNQANVLGFTMAGLRATLDDTLTARNASYARYGPTLALVGFEFQASVRSGLGSSLSVGPPTGVLVHLSPGIRVDNVTARGNVRGVDVSLSPQFEFEDGRIEDCSDGLFLAGAGHGSLVRNVAIVNATLGVNITDAGFGYDLGDYDIDFTTGNSINGRPILGFYNTQSPVVNPAGAYGWLFSYGAWNARVTGLDIPFNAGSPAAVWVASNNSIIDGSAVRGARDGFFVGTSSQLSLLSNDFLSNTSYGLFILFGDTVILRDSLMHSLGASGVVFQYTMGVTAINLTGIGAMYGLFDNGGRVNTLSDSQFNGSNSYAGVFLSGVTLDRIERSGICTLGPASASSLVLDAAVDTFLMGNAYCAGRNGVDGVSTRTLIENTTFTGTAIGVSLSTAGIVRWNLFQNCTSYGVQGLSGPGGNSIYENNFLCGALSGYAPTGSTDLWYNSSRGHGNYWDAYAGVDANGDSIGDTPYNVPGPGNRRDLFPLIVPYETVPPVAIAIVPFAIDEDTVALLNGSRSADNVGITGGYWVVYDIGGPVTVQGVVANYTFATPGVFNAVLTVHDAWNNSASASGTVRVRDKTAPRFSTPPTNAITDEDLDVQLMVQVADNDPLFPGGSLFTWVFTGRGNLTRTSSQASVLINFPDPGTYFCNLTIADAGGNSVAGSFLVTVRDKTPPTFNFVPTGPLPPAQGETVGLEMRNPQDNDLNFPGPNAFYWMVILPGGGLVENFNRSWNFTVPFPGFYEVRYECKDPTGNMRRGNYTWTSDDTEPPIWTAPQGLVVDDGANLTLSAEDATDYSGLGGAVWSDNAFVVSRNLTFERTWVGLGNHTVTVVVSDAVGNSASFSFVLLVIDGTSPRLLDANFTRLITVREQQPVDIDASDQFADNDPAFATTATWAWTSDAPDITWGSPQNVSRAILLFNRSGHFTLHLRVTDASGNFAAIAIPVNVTDGTAPTGITWTANPGFNITLGQKVTLQAAASDPSGVFFRWEFGDGSVEEGAAVEYEYVAIGRFHVTLTVTDGEGNAAKRYFDILVGPQGGGPIDPNNTGPDDTPGGSKGISTSTILLIAAAVVGVGIAAMAVAFRKKLKARPLQPVIIQAEAPAYPQQQQQQAYANTYGYDTYDPYGQYPPADEPPKFP